MQKNILSGALLFCLMFVSTTSIAEILVNHHGHPFQQSEAHHISHHRISHQRSSHHQSAHRPVHHGRQQRYHYRSDAQHRKVMIGCLRMKNGHHYRVC